MGAYRIAVVGAGPAGLYTADALLRSGEPVTVDVYDKLVAPFGLVRYGVAPDHPKIKSIATVLRRILETPGVRFLGNVGYGADLTLDDLHAHYDAVVFSTGAAWFRALDVPGATRPGSHTAGAFVAWYNGHPEVAQDFPLDATAAAVVGAGNVALDVARVLGRGPEGLAATDVPVPVLDRLRASRVTDVHVLARRGPADAKFTPLELRELGKVPGLRVVVHADPAELDVEADERRVRNNLAAIRGWAEAAAPAEPAEPPERTLHLWFRTRPVELTGAGEDGAVSGLVVESTAAGTVGERTELPVQAVFAAIGYRGAPVPGLPFDDATGTVPADAGRALAPDGTPVPGVYVAGWIKRGPTGVIGTNKPDGAETAASVLADLAAAGPPGDRDPDAALGVLHERGVEPVTWDGWLAVEAAEAELGRAAGRERVKLADPAELLAAAGRAPERDPVRDPARDPVPGSVRG